MHRRGILRSAFAAAVAALGFARFATDAQARTKHIRIYVEMDVAPAREREMLETFHNVFVPEAVKHQGYIRVKMLKRRSFIQGTAPAHHNYRASGTLVRLRSFGMSWRNESVWTGSSTRYGSNSSIRRQPRSASMNVKR